MKLLLFISLFVSYIGSTSYLFKFYTFERKSEVTKSVNSSIATGIYINEFMASNDHTDIPGYSGYDDWIEIHNSNNFAVDISGFYITDNLSKPTKAQLPITPGSAIIPANGYIVIICDGNPSLGGDFHVSFGLSASGEEIGLFDQSEHLIDSIVFGSQLRDISMGRNPDNINDWRYFKKPTPKTINNLIDSYSEILPPPVFSHVGGIYTNNFNLVLSTDIPGAVIYYTLDGSEPDPNHLEGESFTYKNSLNGPFLYEYMTTYEYAGQIEVKDRTLEDNRVSMKRSSLGGSNSYFPNNNIAKGTVIKAIIYKEGALPVSATHTYFVFDSLDKYSFPISSISIDEKYLFDYNIGMYTPGALAKSNEWTSPANYKENWRYEGNFEYFEDGVNKINERAGIEIHGGASRFFPQKSLKIFNHESVEYDMFKPNKYEISKNLILRNGGNNWEDNFVKDVINHEILQYMNMLSQRTQPTISFINGEYWGILNARDRIDKNFIKTNFKVDSDNLDLLKISYKIDVKSGDKIAWNNLKSFINSRNFGDNYQANYDSLKTLIDIDNFIDYNIAQIYIGNSDWPNNNVLLWRSKDKNNSNKFSDGKWRWVLFDTDITSSSGFNSLYRLVNYDHENAMIFKKIYQNNEFKQKFISRFLDLINSHFVYSRTNEIVTTTRAKYEVELSEHIERWKKPIYTDWESKVNSQNSYFKNRPKSQRSHLKAIYSLGNEYNLTLNVLDTTQGYVSVNTIDILPSTPGISEKAYPWTGIYFSNIQTTLTANVKKGAKFSHWLKNGSYFSSDLTITFDLTSNQTYTAVFEEHILSGTPYPVAKILDECGYSFTSWPATASENTYPDHMSFVYFLKTDSNNEDHRIEDELGGLYNMNYNRSSQNRINGLGNDGISFINTGSDLGGITDAKLGGAIVAINTLGQDSVFINWTGGTILKNDRKYRIRLQYRIGDLQDFKDLLDENDEVIEYKTNDTPGHEQHFKDILLPVDALDKPYVQLLWRYFYKGSKTSGKRSQLRLDDILITTSKFYDINIKHSGVDAEFNRITSKATVKKQGVTNYTASSSIVLGPGFNTENNAVFKAEIKQCD